MTDKPKSPIEQNHIEKFWFYLSLSVMCLPARGLKHHHHAQESEKNHGITPTHDAPRAKNYD